MMKLKFGHRVIAWDHTKSASFKGRFISSNVGGFCLLVDGASIPEWYKNCELDLARKSVEHRTYIPRFRERMGIVLNETKEPVASGDLVRYDHHVEVVEELKAENERLREYLNEALRHLRIMHKDIKPNGLIKEILELLKKDE